MAAARALASRSAEAGLAAAHAVRAAEPRSALRQAEAGWPTLFADGLALPGSGVSLGLLAGLQRVAGNAAVHHLVQRSATVKRCGADEPAAQVAQRAAILFVQRDDYQDGTPENPNPELPPGSAYAHLDPELRATLGRTLTAHAYGPWAGSKPTNLGAALDQMGVENINTLVQLKGRMFPIGLWSKVETIKNVWTTSSLGIDYNGPSMQGDLDAAQNFCKDTSIGEAYHSGNCWREVVEANTPGLHFCTPNSIHIDPHQTSVGQQGGVQFGGGSIMSYRGNYCKYSLIAFVSHMMDVEGGRAVNVFHRYAMMRDRIRTLRDRAQKMRERGLNVDAQVTTLETLEQRRLALDPTLRGWAVQGFEGGDAGAEAARVGKEMNDIEAQCQRVTTELEGVEASAIEHGQPNSSTQGG